MLCWLAESGYSRTWALHKCCIIRQRQSQPLSFMEAAHQLLPPSVFRWHHLRSVKRYRGFESFSSTVLIAPSRTGAGRLAPFPKLQYSRASRHYCVCIGKTAGKVQREIVVRTFEANETSSQGSLVKTARRHRSQPRILSGNTTHAYHALGFRGLFLSLLPVLLSIQSESQLGKGSQKPALSMRCRTQYACPCLRQMQPA